MATTTTAPRRRRDPEASREAILAAAREAFGEHGYAPTTIREIARRAGVTHGLVIRYFGSKERLMVAALTFPDEVGALVEGDLAELPGRLARGFIARLDNDDAAPLIALIRVAATNEPGAAELAAALFEGARAHYAPVLVGDEIEERLELMAAVLTGFAFRRCVLSAGRLVEMSAEAAAVHLEALLHTVLDPALPG